MQRNFIACYLFLTELGNDGGLFRYVAFFSDKYRTRVAMWQREKHACLNNVEESDYSI